MRCVKNYGTVVGFSKQFSSEITLEPSFEAETGFQESSTSHSSPALEKDNQTIPDSLQFKRILVAYDGSNTATSACRTAASFASRFNSEVTVLNAIRASRFVNTSIEDEHYTHALKESNSLLNEALSLFEREGIQAKKKIVMAGRSIAQAIVDFSSEVNSDLTIVGTRGLGRFKVMLSESVSRRILMHSSSSVLIARRECVGNGRQLERILVVVGVSNNASRAVATAVTLAKNFEAKLTILNVIYTPSAIYTGEVPVSQRSIEIEARRHAESLVSAATALANKHGVIAECEIIQDFESPEQGITRYASENKIGLVVIGTRDLYRFKTRLGSVESGVVSLAPCSVLVAR